MSHEYADAIGLLPLPALLLDERGQVNGANLLAQEQLGTSVRRFSGKHLSDLFAPESEVIRMLARAQAGETVTGDAMSSRFTGAPYSLHIGRMGDDVAVIMIPEANRSEVEKQVRRQEMAEAVARIALEMAHEVKNPLASLRGAAQWLAEHTEDRDTMEIGQHMLAEVDRIRERIDAFLQLGPRADISMEPVNIHALLDDVCRPPQGVQLRRVFDPSLPPLRAHASRLRQAFENLWQNALEAGSHNIEWQSRIAPMTKLPDHAGQVMEVRITSDGAPIPEDLREHLFEPFVTGKERGSGLGLAIVQRVAQEHGGRVQLTSKHGRTTVSIFLPLGGKF